MEAYDYIVVNDDPELCAKQLHGMIEAARSEPVRKSGFIKDIREELKSFREGAV